MKEDWKKIKNYESYMVSDLGRIKSLKGKKEIILTPSDRNGYLKVSLSKNSKVKDITIHRLVMETFIPNNENKTQVNHINGIKTDNRLENLEWSNASENALHAFKLGLRKNEKGDNATYRKVNSKKVVEIKSIYFNQDINQTKLGEMFNISQSAISYIINNKRWATRK